MIETYTQYRVEVTEKGHTPDQWHAPYSPLKTLKEAEARAEDAHASLHGRTVRIIKQEITETEVKVYAPKDLPQTD